MHEDNLFNHILKSHDMNYEIFSSPIGDIYIFGNEEFIKAVIFLKDSKLIQKITSQMRKHKSREISKIYSYFHHYFNSDFDKLKKFKILIKSSKLPYNSKSDANSNSTVIRLDLSTYTKNEIKVYKSLQKINSGKTASYKELGDKSGLSNAARFIGNTMAKNNFPIIIPCHRVIKSNGEIGQYTGGVYIKKFLLDFENEFIP